MEYSEIFSSVILGCTTKDAFLSKVSNFSEIWSLICFLFLAMFACCFFLSDAGRPSKESIDSLDFGRQDGVLDAVEISLVIPDLTNHITKFFL